jgi:hypothetical protein
VKDQEKWHLPERYRIDQKDRTPHMERLLELSNEQQKELAEKYASPFLSITPADKQRARASVLIGEFKASKRAKSNTTRVEREQLAEAYATVGLYAEAVRMAPTKKLKAEYQAVYESLYIPDSVWCEDGRAFAYAEKDIFSIKGNCYVSLMRCGKCGFRNAKDTPSFVTVARKRRAGIRAKYSGLSPLEAKRQMEADGVIK